MRRRDFLAGALACAAAPSFAAAPRRPRLGFQVYGVRDLCEVEQTKLLETRKFKFRCGCTVEKVLPVVRAMMRDFADQLSEQGFLEISCPRCGASYKVTPDMVLGQDEQK